MPNIIARDGNNNIIELGATGSGTAADPYVRLVSIDADPVDLYLFARPDAAEQTALQRVKRVVGTGYDRPHYPHTLIDMAPAGLSEIWVFGWRQRILKYNYKLELLEAINTYGTPNRSNNLTYPWDAWIDFARNEVFITTWNYNHCRVYDLNAFINSTYVRGGFQAGGHLYDVGLPNGNVYFRADKGSASRNGEGGAFYNVSGVVTEGSKLYISSYKGYANASQTGNVGFIAEYDLGTGGAGPTFNRIVAQYNGSNSSGLTATAFRNPYGKLRVRPGAGTLIATTNVSQNGGFGYYEIDLAANTMQERRVQPTSSISTFNWRPFGVEFDSAGNLLTTQRGPNGAVVAIEDGARDLVVTAGDNLSGEGEAYWKAADPRHAICLENVDGYDWLMVADYSQHAIALYRKPTSLDSDGTPTFPLIFYLEKYDRSVATLPPLTNFAQKPDIGLDINTMVANLPANAIQDDLEIWLLFS